jgi:uncharacterized repeat protein (TIGR01451 family)
MITALWTRGRLTAVRTVLTLALAMCCGVGLAQAQTPVIDGNGDDLINFAAGIGANGCAVDRADPRDDIAVADPKVDPCATLEDTDANGVPDYYVNGKDLRRYVSVYDSQNDDLYILFRVEGVIGDVDGNGNPDNNLCVPPANFNDQAGIGSEDTYEARYDIDCDGNSDITIRVQNNEVTVTGATVGSTSFAYVGGDLEVAVMDIGLPVVFQTFAFSGAIRDGLGEDITPTTTCGTAAPSIDLVKSVLPAVICGGQTADFTLEVRNDGNVDLTGVTVVDNLPAGLAFVSTVSNTCGGAVAQVGNQITYGPFNLAAGASCTIVIRAGRAAECSGDQTNLASVEGTFQSPCVNNGEAIIVSDKASATVLCGNVTCSIDAPDTQVCPGETVQICGPEGNFSWAWSNGATTRCITVGAGTYSLVITDLASGCVSTNQCSVTIVENPRPVCSIEAQDTSVCPGETVQICGPEGSFTYAWSNGATTRCITVGAGTYSLVITNTVTGCVSDNTCSVTIVESPRPVCSIEAQDTSVCGKETVQICGPEGPYTYAWSNGATTRCITVGAGTYSLVITNTETGCSSDNTCSVTITTDSPPCVEVTVNDQGPRCVGATFDLCGTVRNCGDRTSRLEVRYGDQLRAFDDVPAGASRDYCFEGVVMPACTGDGVPVTVRAVAINTCGTSPEDTASDTIPCAAPQIDVEKVAQESTVANGGTIHYTITVRNPSATVSLENIRVVDDLCAYARWTGVSNPAPFSAPAVNTAGGIVEWRFASLAPGAEQIITFEVTADVAAGGGVCPTTVQCQNDVYATGECLGSGGQSTVRDDDSITTPITCASDNCPRTVGFWGSQCAQRGNGSTKFTLAQMTQIAECIDDRSSFFNWSAGTDFDRLCSIINPSSPMQQRKQAKRQFAGVLANLCTDFLNLQPSQGGRIFLDPSTPISCAGLEADTIGELIDEVDDILAELEGQDLNDPAVKTRYGQLISCLDAINNGQNIPVASDCEHQAVVPTDESEAMGANGGGAAVELYRPSPNPFSGTTSFAYSVDAIDGAAVEITVYDVAGRQMRKIVSGVQAAGRHTAAWDGRTDSGAKANRGVYFVRTVIGGVKASTNRVLYLND